MIQKHIIYHRRGYRLDIPVPIMNAMGWGDDLVALEPDPENSAIVVKNTLKKPIDMTQFLIEFDRQKWVRNKGELKRRIQNRSPEAKRIYYETDWDEIEDGGYYVVEQYYQMATSFQKGYADTNPQLKEAARQIVSSLLLLAKAQQRYLESKKCKKPDWFGHTEKKISTLEKHKW